MGSVPLVTELTDLRNIATCILFGTLFIFLLWTTGRYTKWLEVT